MSLELLPRVGAATARLLSKILGVSTCEELSKIEGIEDKVLQSEVFSKAPKRMQNIVRRVDLANLAKIATDIEAPSKTEEGPPKKKAKTSSRKKKKKAKTPAVKKPPPKVPEATPRVEAESVELHEATPQFLSRIIAKLAADSTYTERDNDEWVLLRINWQAPRLLSLYLTLDASTSLTLSKKMRNALRARAGHVFDQMTVLPTEQQMLERMLPKEVFQLRRRSAADALTVKLSTYTKLPLEVLHLMAEYAGNGFSFDTLESLPTSISERLDYHYERELEACTLDASDPSLACQRALARLLMETSDSWRLARCAVDRATLGVEVLDQAMEVTPSDQSFFDVSVNYKGLLQHARRLGLLMTPQQATKHDTTSTGLIDRVLKCLRLLTSIKTQLGKNNQELPLEFSAVSLKTHLSGQGFDDLIDGMPAFLYNEAEFTESGVNYYQADAKQYRNVVDDVVMWLRGHFASEQVLPLIHTIHNEFELARLLNLLDKLLPDKAKQNWLQHTHVALGDLCRHSPAHNSRQIQTEDNPLSDMPFYLLEQLLAEGQPFSERHHLHRSNGPTFSTAWLNGNRRAFGFIGLNDHRAAVKSVMSTALLRVFFTHGSECLDVHKLCQRYVLLDLLSKADLSRQCLEAGSAEPLLEETEMMHSLQSFFVSSETNDKKLWPLEIEDDSTHTAADHVGDMPASEQPPLLRRSSSILERHADLPDNLVDLLSQEFPDKWQFFDYQRHNIAAMLRRERDSRVAVDLVSGLSPLTGRRCLPRMLHLKDDVALRRGVPLNFVADAYRGVLIHADSLVTHVGLPGGLLCDQVGLGKTAQLLALCALQDHRPAERDESNEDAQLQPSGRRVLDATNKQQETLGHLMCIVNTKQDETTMLRLRSDATLVLCPSHLCAQWEVECRRLLSKSCGEREDAVVVCAKPRSHARIKGFAMLRARFVIISFAALRNLKDRFIMRQVMPQVLNLLHLHQERNTRSFHCTSEGLASARVKKSSMLLPNQIHWRRIIIDECHELLSDTHLHAWMRGHGTPHNWRGLSAASDAEFVMWAIRALRADFKWAATGTPGACMPHTLMPLVEFLNSSFVDAPLFNYDRHLADLLETSRERDITNEPLPVWLRQDLRLALLMSYNIARNGLRRNTQWSAESECYVPDFEEVEDRYDLTRVETVLVNSCTSTPAALAMIQHPLVERSSLHLPEGQTLSSHFPDLPLDKEDTRAMSAFAEAGAFGAHRLLRQRIAFLRDFIARDKISSVPVQRAITQLRRLLAKDENESLESLLKCSFDASELLPSDLAFGSSKLTRITDYVHRVLTASAKHRVIVFSTTRRFMRLLQHSLAACGHKAAVVMYSYAQRQRALQAFRSGVTAVREAKDEDALNVASRYPRVLVLNVESAASGLDILGVSHVVLADVIFGRAARAVQAQETQAVARALRQSRDESMRQSRLEVRRFLARGTLEERQYDSLVAQLRAD